MDKPILGKNVSLIPTSKFGSEPYLIKIGDNTTVSFGCTFVNHDGATRVLRNLPNHDPQTILYGVIVVGKNCFIGCNTTVLPGVHIGDNTIIGAGSVVTTDIPSNVVAAGVPCKVIGTLDGYIEKHKNEFEYILKMPYEEKKKYLLKKFEKELK